MTESIEEPANVATWHNGDGIYAEGRVPGPGGRGYVTKIIGPFLTYREAADSARARRLGGARAFEVREGRRVV